MEGFGSVSKRGRRIYKDGLFPSKWSRFATTNYLAKDFETSHFPEPTSVWLKTPLSPLRSPRLRRGDFSLPSTMPRKGKKTSTFDPAVPPFDGQASFSLPVPSGSDSPFSGSSTPTPPTSSYTPPPLPPRESSAPHLRPSPPHPRHPQSLGLPQGLHNPPSPPLPPIPRALRGLKSLGGPGSPPPSQERRPQRLHLPPPRNPRRPRGPSHSGSAGSSSNETAPPFPPRSSPSGTALTLPSRQPLYNAFCAAPPTISPSSPWRQ